MTAEPDTRLCDACGHPRHKHEYVNEMYPAMCGHADPIAADQETGIEDAICWCLEFRPSTFMNHEGGLLP